MEEKISTKEKSNPIFNTAKFTLNNLANAGIEEAKKYLLALGFDEEKTASYGITGKASGSTLLTNAIIQEARYCFINRMIEEKGYKNIFDLACGFSPRGYKYSKLGYRYVGVDLPATVELVAPVARKVSDGTCKIPVEYKALDLTNPASLTEAAKMFDGEICIVVEGLLMYLDPFETSQFADGIYNVLREHGGCFVTPDYNSGGFYKAVTFSLLGEEEGMKFMLDAKKNLEKTSDAGISTEKISKSTAGGSSPYEFFTNRGFKIESVPFCGPSTVLGSLGAIDAEIAGRTKAALSKTEAWVLTVDASRSVGKTSPRESSSEAGMELCEGALNIILPSRLDSINAPEMIEAFESLPGDSKITSVFADMKELCYISSAGLRFLLTVQKKTGCRIAVSNVSPDVMQIFETTGFDTIFDFE